MTIHELIRKFNPEMDVCPVRDNRLDAFFIRADGLTIINKPMCKLIKKRMNMYRVLVTLQVPLPIALSFAVLSIHWECGSIIYFDNVQWEYIDDYASKINHEFGPYNVGYLVTLVDHSRLF